MWSILEITYGEIDANNTGTYSIDGNGEITIVYGVADEKETYFGDRNGDRLGIVFDGTKQIQERLKNTEEYKDVVIEKIIYTEFYTKVK